MVSCNGSDEKGVSAESIKGSRVHGIQGPRIESIKGIVGNGSIDNSISGECANPPPVHNVQVKRHVNG